MQSIVALAVVVAALDRVLLYRTYVRELRRCRESSECFESLSRYAVLIRPRAALGGLRAHHEASPGPRHVREQAEAPGVNRGPPSVT